MLADPRHRGSDASHGRLVLTQLSDARSDRTQKQACEYLVDDQWSDQLGFCRLRHRLDQARQALVALVGLKEPPARFAAGLSRTFSVRISASDVPDAWVRRCEQVPP